MRVFVGGVAEHDLPIRVLEFSIRRRSSIAVSVERLDATGIAIPTPRDPANRSRTKFSFQRFTIPEAASFVGRAVYLDSDMLVLGDIAELANIPVPEKAVVAAPNQSAVMVIDCEIGWKISEFVAEMDAGQLTYGDLMQLRRGVGQVFRDLPPQWNMTDRVEADTKLLHFTRVKTQPWLVEGHPLTHLWEDELRAALDAGVISESSVRESIARGWVRKSLGSVLGGAS